MIQKIHNNSTPLKITITGCTGRMGQSLVSEIKKNPADFIYTGGTVRDIQKYSKDVLESLQPVSTEADDLFSNSDVIIDFTSPEATLQHIQFAVSLKKPIVIGTTGLSDSDIQAIKNAATNIPVILAPNTSVGVTALLSLVEQASRLLAQDFDIEISEIHHKRKVDAPSGTAMALGAAAARGADLAWPQSKLPARDGITGPRPETGIGFGVLRGGDVVGEHTVYYFGDGERIELTHRATDRKLFASGALRAAKWLANKPAGFYTMKDVLGI